MTVRDLILRLLSLPISDWSREVKVDCGGAYSSRELRGIDVVGSVVLSAYPRTPQEEP